MINGETINVSKLSTVLEADTGWIRPVSIDGFNPANQRTLLAVGEDCVEQQRLAYEAYTMQRTKAGEDTAQP